MNICRHPVMYDAMTACQMAPPPVRYCLIHEQDCWRPASAALHVMPHVGQPWYCAWLHCTAQWWDICCCGGLMPTAFAACTVSITASAAVLPVADRGLHLHDQLSRNCWQSDSSSSTQQGAGHVAGSAWCSCAMTQHIHTSAAGSTCAFCFSLDLLLLAAHIICSSTMPGALP